jgi:hypothetical protein
LTSRRMKRPLRCDCLPERHTQNSSMIDDIVKSPYAALRFILRHCDVRTSTPHSSGFVRLASGAFYFVVSIMTFYEFIND